MASHYRTLLRSVVVPVAVPPAVGSAAAVPVGRHSLVLAVVLAAAGAVVLSSY